MNRDSEFKNKRILISGGSSGIGLALAKKFFALGNDVFILGRNEKRLYDAELEIEKFRQKQSQKLTCIPADVREFSKLKDSLGTITDIDVLINSAGITYPGRFLDLDPEIFEDIITTNYLGTVYLTKLVAPVMVEKRSGYIVNLSSLAALVGIFGYTAYAPSKYAIRGFSRCLRAEMKTYGIDVSVALPPDTDTPQLEFERSIMPETTKKINSSAGMMDPDNVAEIIFRGMEKKKFSIIPGIEGKLLYLFAPLIGRYLFRLAVREERKIIK